MLNHLVNWFSVPNPSSHVHCSIVGDNEGNVFRKIIFRSIIFPACPDESRSVATSSQFEANSHALLHVFNVQECCVQESSMQEGGGGGGAQGKLPPPPPPPKQLNFPPKLTQLPPQDIVIMKSILPSPAT